MPSKFDGSSPLARGLLRAVRPTARDTPDHPRSRGVYATGWSSSQAIAGSSPLARGLRRNDDELTVSGRIIPARAGFTPRGTWARRGTSDHPRSRGVYVTPPSTERSSRGSSPLARGLQLRMPWAVAHARIIPARAGFTRSSSGSCLRSWDHPRSRGVYGEPGGSPVHTNGSSPLARGLRSRCSPPWCSAGIIPARAGFTAPRTWGGSRCWDHPRSRGVYISRSSSRGMAAGSSPLARGLLVRDVIRWRRRLDHPRSRGVYIRRFWSQLERIGSSPLARGLPVSSCWGTRSSTDHPRSRGVYALRGTPATSPCGSSPLARGLQRRGAHGDHHPRIIPARAGFTLSAPLAAHSRRDHPRSRGVYARGAGRRSR